MLGEKFVFRHDPFDFADQLDTLVRSSQVNTCICELDELDRVARACEYAKINSTVRDLAYSDSLKGLSEQSSIEPGIEIPEKSVSISSSGSPQSLS